MNNRFGFDISLYQDNDYTPQTPDFTRMWNYGASFIIIRAGQGTWEDPDFRINWMNARGILPRHSYWYYDNRYRPRQQARLYWSLIEDDFEGMMWLDLEHMKAGDYKGWKGWFDFLDELINVIGVPADRIGIYTGYYYWVENAPKTELSLRWFGQFKLWLAWYTTKVEEVQIPKPWKTMFLWQDGTYPVGPLVGVESREIDHDFFMGTEEEFQKYFGGTTPPPDTGEPMILYYADLKANYKSNVRTAPDLDATAGIQTMTGPLTISIISEKVVADGYEWYQISAPLQGWIALTTSYTNFRPANTTPPAEDPVIKVTAETLSGAVYVSTTMVKQ